jgi:transposase
MGHRRGENRQQAALFPVMLDELVQPHSIVRVVDAWVASLDLKVLGFQKARAQVMGAPAYDPADLLKLYVWGYLSAIRSSRALERECHRNVECMWLLGRLAPDHKTIANFRSANSAALVASCAAFVQFARAQALIAGRTVAIDGTKIRAVASRKAIRRKQDLDEQARHIAEQIAQYLQVLDATDLEDAGSEPRAADVERALEQLRARQAQVQRQAQELAQSNASSLVSTEPDARVMGPGNLAPAYNLQTAVDSESHLIVAQQVVTEANDQRQLLPMAEAVAQALAAKPTVVADGGYANGEHIAQLDAKGITSYVASARAVNNQGDCTLYDRGLFHYDNEGDRFICPAGHPMRRKQVHNRDKMVIYAARKEDCRECARKPHCTQAAQRFVTRHLYEDALQANARRVEENPQMMALRRQTVEHPFGDIKHRILGNGRLLLRGLQGARGELSIAVLAYNLKRLFNMKGGVWIRQALGA